MPPTSHGPLLRVEMGAGVDVKWRSVAGKWEADYEGIKEGG